LHNRRVLNETAKRLFFVEEPVSVSIEGLPQKTVRLSYFPSTKQHEREFVVTKNVLLARVDVKHIGDGELSRLMDAANFTKNGAAYAYAGDSLDEYRAHGKRIVHYLPAEHDSVAVEILMPDLTVRKGLGESRVRELAVGDHVQFERVGFCRLDSIENNTYTFWFTHK
jgi:glutamyl-tRNA synthetase